MHRGGQTNSQFSLFRYSYILAFMHFNIYAFYYLCILLLCILLFMHFIIYAFYYICILFSSVSIYFTIYTLHNPFQKKRIGWANMPQIALSN